MQEAPVEHTYWISIDASPFVVATLAGILESRKIDFKVLSPDEVLLLQENAAKHIRSLETKKNYTSSDQYRQKLKERQADPHYKELRARKALESREDRKYSEHQKRAMFRAVMKENPVMAQKYRKRFNVGRKSELQSKLKSSHASDNTGSASEQSNTSSSGQ